MGKALIFYTLAQVLETCDIWGAGGKKPTALLKSPALARLFILFLLLFHAAICTDNMSVLSGGQGGKKLTAAKLNSNYPNSFIMDGTS